MTRTPQIGPLVTSTGSDESLVSALLASNGELPAKPDFAGGVERWEVMSRDECSADNMPLAEHPMTIAYVSSCQQGNFMIYVSSQVENLGFTTEAWLGKPDLRLQQIHEDDLEQVEKAMWHSCRTAEKLSCRYRLYDNAGNIRWFHDEATVMCDESGAPLFMMGAMRDITEIKEMEEELNEHRYYLEKKVEQRTEQLLKRITLLESCNATLCDKLAQARRDIAALRGQLAGAMSGVGANDCLGRNGVVKNMIKPGEKDDWIGCLASA